MKARERFDKLLLSCRDRIEDEVAALIGKPFKLGDASFRLASKEELFAEISGKQVLSHVKIDGDLQGATCLLVGVKDAIYIGGTLIMLPESEIESVVVSAEYSEELQDSFGEVANIICGAVTVIFEEQYSKNVRLIRTEQEVINPAKVDVGSESPIADVPYYIMTVGMRLDDRELGNLILPLPAALFGLIAETEADSLNKPDKVGASDASSVASAPQQDNAATDSTGENTDVEVAQDSEPPISPASDTVSGPAREDLDKSKKLVDKLLKNCLAKVSEDVSALIGGTLKVEPLEHDILSKGEVLEQAGGKQIMTRMEIRGEGAGEAFLFLEVKTAVYLGGTLIMLPEGELEEAARNEDFGDDASDAYGEIANIIAGVYTASFEEQSRMKLGFVKTSMEQVVPVKIDPDSDEVIPNRIYYLSTGQILFNDKDLGRFQMVIPANVLGLEALYRIQNEPLIIEQPKQEHPAPPPKTPQVAPAEPANVLIFTDDDSESGNIATVLQQMGYTPSILHFKDQVNPLLTPRIQIIFLVMREVSEQGFGVAIKISSAGRSIPLVAAGPAWTRTLVLKAVKYGACDILVTPSSAHDIQEKIETNLVKKAA